MNGRKRHILVDASGLLMRAIVHTADIQDREGAKLLLADLKDQFPRLSLIWADHGYDGAPFSHWVKQNTGCTLEITKKPGKWQWTKEGEEPTPVPTFTPVPRRWVVERTFAWCGRNRRLTRDYEGRPETEQALIYMAMGRTALKRTACP